MIINNKKKSKYESRELDFLTLIQNNQDRMYRIAYSYVKNKEDTLDVIQETTMKCYIAYHKVKYIKYEGTWLIRVLINTAIDFMKKKKKILAMEMKHSEIRSYDEVDNRMILHDALDKLNEVERQVVVLRYFEDLKLQDVANLLGKPISTIKSTLYRALKKLEVDMMEGKQ